MDNTLDIERNTWIAASVEEVWEMLTVPEKIGAWWPPNEWEFSALEEGGQVTFGAFEGAAHATIELLNPPHILRLHWEPNSSFPTNRMTTTFTLEEEQGGTRLTVIESGFASLPADIRSHRAEKTADGYVLVLRNLKALLERDRQ
jgi:uncharacterized protein YndB with AHSA1/START domain